MPSLFDPRLQRRSLFAGVVFAALAGGVAEAQSACGETYLVEHGDTLNKIAAACAVSVSDLQQANPGLEPRALEVGTWIDIPQTRASRAMDGQDAADSGFVGFAQGIGRLLSEIANEDEAESDPSRIQADAVIRPKTGRPGDWVTIAADGFDSGEEVGIGVGRAESEFQVVKRARADWRGYVETDVLVPEWAEAGDDLIFVAADEDLKAASGRFDVAGGGVEGDGRRLRVRGRVQEGPECPYLETPDGDVYSLVSEGQTIPVGHDVEASGYAAGLSICQRGTTLDVTDFRTVSSPDEGEDTLTVRGQVEAGVECPVLSAEDGRSYALVGEASLAPGDYVEVSGRRAGFSYCMQGDATLEVTGFEQISRQGESSAPERRQLTGRLIDAYRGCMALRTDDNDIWKLADLRESRLVGERVTVSGDRQKGSPCGSGPTLQVESIELSDARRDPDRAAPVLDKADLVGTWARRGSDCARPDMEISENAAGGLVVETRLNGEPRTGYVRRGASASFIFDLPRRIFPLKQVAPDRLSVSAPMNALNQQIAGTDIPRDGAIYVRCRAPR